ncbi:MAG: ABC transporter permease subunit [Zavarzinella sp.]
MPFTLKYRAGSTDRSGPWAGTLAIARTSFAMLTRRRMFWVLFIISMLIFTFYFFAQYLQVFLEQRVSATEIRTGGIFGRMMKPDIAVKLLRDALHMNGTTDTYGDFIWTEGYIAVIILAFAGSILIGSDFQHNSLPFYLSKPIGRRHYVFGKVLAVGVVINCMTTLPALVLFIQYGFIDTWRYYIKEFRLALGIIAYGSAITVVLSLLLIMVATWVRRTVPIVLIWTAMFVLSRLIQRWLVDGLELSPRWRLIDVWNNLYLFGMWCMGHPHSKIRPTDDPQPAYWEATAVLVGITLFSIWYLQRRVRAVEVIR